MAAGVKLSLMNFESKLELKLQFLQPKNSSRLWFRHATLKTIEQDVNELKDTTKVY